MTLLGRIFRLPPKLTSLLAIGSSICGVTAIMAAQGAYRSRRRKTPHTAIAAILTLGAIALFTFPAIGHLPATSQPAGLRHVGRPRRRQHRRVRRHRRALRRGRGPLDCARQDCPLLLHSGSVVLGYTPSTGLLQGKAAHVVEHKALFLWQKFPKFILGFVAISVLATAGFFYQEPAQRASRSLSQWAFLPAFAGVGLPLHQFDEGPGHCQGWRPLIVGILGEAFIALLTLGLVYWSYNHGVSR